MTSRDMELLPVGPGLGMHCVFLYGDWYEEGDNRCISYFQRLNNKASRARVGLEGDPSTASQTQGTTDLNVCPDHDLCFVNGMGYCPRGSPCSCLASLKPRPGLIIASTCLLAHGARQPRHYLW